MHSKGQLVQNNPKGRICSKLKGLIRAKDMGAHTSHITIILAGDRTQENNCTVYRRRQQKMQEY